MNSPQKNIREYELWGIMNTGCHGHSVFYKKETKVGRADRKGTARKGELYVESGYCRRRVPGV